MKAKILFVCLGNICRSPAAEGIMKKQLENSNLRDAFYIDSAGIIDCHEGELPDSRMRYHAVRRGYLLDSRSRPINYNDFFDFDLIIGMDDRNIEALNKKAPTLEAAEKIRRMTDFCKNYQADHVPDPYYGGAEGFEYVLDLLEDACEGLINSIREKLNF